MPTFWEPCPGNKNALPINVKKAVKNGPFIYFILRNQEESGDLYMCHNLGTCGVDGAYRRIRGRLPSEPWLMLDVRGDFRALLLKFFSLVEHP